MRLVAARSGVSGDIIQWRKVGKSHVRIGSLTPASSAATGGPEPNESGLRHVLGGAPGTA
jgi:hypothetical protein